MDLIPLTRSVLFIGDYFSLITTVTLLDEHRRPDEGDEDYAVRLASDLMLLHYGWDVAAQSANIGVMDEDTD
jgi:hypothetical protein